LPSWNWRPLEFHHGDTKSTKIEYSTAETQALETQS
jgi:hypothetical protein